MSEKQSEVYGNKWNEGEGTVKVRGKGRQKEMNRPKKVLGRNTY